MHIQLNCRCLLFYTEDILVFSCCLLKQTLPCSLLTWRGYKTGTWTLSAKFPKAKPGDSAVKAISISVFSIWLLSESPHPPPKSSLPSTHPQEMDKRRSRWRMCTGKQSQTKLAQGRHIKIKSKTYCMGWQDWAFCSPGLRRRGEDRVRLVSARAELQAAVPSWVTSAWAVDGVTGGLASVVPPV